MILQTIYYILEGYVVFLGIVGTWRLVQLTRERGTIVNVSIQENRKRSINFIKILILQGFSTYTNGLPVGKANLKVSLIWLY
jgi:hypothetical protein